MLVFALGALQTIEWNHENGTPVPFLAYILLVVVAIWCVCAAKVRQCDIDEFDNHNNTNDEE